MITLIKFFNYEFIFMIFLINIFAFNSLKFSKITRKGFNRNVLTLSLYSTKQEPKSPIESNGINKMNILTTGLSLTLLQLSSKKVNAVSTSTSIIKKNNAIKSKILLEEVVENNEIIG